MSTEARFTTLEQAMADLARAQVRTEGSLDRLSGQAARTEASLDRLASETAASQARMDARLDRLSSEMAASQARTDANLDRLSSEIAALHSRTDATLVQQSKEVAAAEERSEANRNRLWSEAAAAEARTRANLELLSTEVRATTQQMGESARKMGRLAEDIVAPSIPTCFQKLFGVENPESIVRAKRRNRHDPRQEREFDVLAWGGGVFLVNSTKTRVRPEDIEPFVASLAEVRHYFHEAEDRRVVGSFSSFYVDPSLVRAAERAGLLVFGLGSGLLEVLNTPGFEPRSF